MSYAQARDEIESRSRYQLSSTQDIRKLNMVNQKVSAATPPTLAQLEEEYLEHLNFSQKKAKGHPVLVFLLDCSGSMGMRIKEVVAGFNGYLEKASATAPSTMVTVYTFNEDISILVPPAVVGKIKPLSVEDFEIEGGTRLYSAIRQVISEVASRTSAPGQPEPGSITLAIFSDGDDQSSDSLDDTKELILEAEDNGWNIEFYLMGSLSSKVAMQLGINPKKITDASNVKEAFLQIGRSK